MAELGTSPVKRRKGAIDQDELDEDGDAVVSGDKSQGLDKNHHLRRLLDTYKKFEKRKVMKPEKYY